MILPILRQQRLATLQLILDQSLLRVSLRVLRAMNPMKLHRMQAEVLTLTRTVILLLTRRETMGKPRLIRAQVKMAKARATRQVMQTANHPIQAQQTPVGVRPTKLLERQHLTPAEARTVRNLVMLLEVLMERLRLTQSKV